MLKSRIALGLWLLVGITLLSGCGFKLRGAYQLPATMSKTYIAAPNRNSEMVLNLTRALEASDVEVVDTQSQATASLSLHNETTRKRVLSVDARGRPREYELTYSISLSVSGQGNDFSLATQKLSLTRDFLFDTEDVLGTGREEGMLINDMKQDMVRLILLKLQAAGKQ